MCTYRKKRGREEGGGQITAHCDLFSFPDINKPCAALRTCGRYCGLH
jgi:hypothetical protein